MLYEEGSMDKQGNNKLEVSNNQNNKIVEYKEPPLPKTKKENRKNKFWIVIGIGSALFLLIIVLSSILSIGEKLRSIHEYVEYGFYVLSVFLIYFLIINPARIIMLAPSFSVVTILDQKSGKNYRLCKRITKNILSNTEIPDEGKELLSTKAVSKIELRENLHTFFDTYVKKEINKVIFKNAKTVMLSTAISQNGKLDMITVIAVNLKMIKQIVEKCGFRPSYAKLGKLSVNVLTTALIAEGLEGIDFNELFPNSTANILADVPFVRTLINSVLQGISNALLTIRIGVVTRKYLFSEYKELDKSEVRKDAFKESIKMLPDVIKDVLSYFPNRIARMFTKPKTDKSEV